MLKDIHLEVNSLTDIPAGAIELQTSDNLVHLNGNHISNIAEGALIGN